MERTIDRIYNKVDTIFVGSFLVIIFILLSFLLFVGSFFANLFVPVLFMVIITLIVIKFTGVDILYYNLRNARIEVSELEDMIRLDEREKLNNIEGLFVKIESVNRIISNIKSSSIFNLIDGKIGGRIQKLLYDLDSRLKILFNDLKEDMKFHIESQKDLLLRGNHNVSQVLQDMKDRENQEILELQKARLDRQIAQFDVLQKLLVKA